MRECKVKSLGVTPLKGAIIDNNSINLQEIQEDFNIDAECICSDRVITNFNLVESLVSFCRRDIYDELIVSFENPY